MNPASTTASAMAEGRRADSARRRRRVLKALDAAAASGEEISVTSIARKAGVDRTFLYRHRDLLGQLHALEAQPPNTAGTGPAVSRASLHADLLAARERAARLAARVRRPGWPTARTSPWSAPERPSSTANSSNDPARTPNRKPPKRSSSTGLDNCS